MGTLLVNAKMDPELAARVEASVTGKRGRSKARFVAVARLVVLLLVAFVIHTAVEVRRREREELAQARNAVLTVLHSNADGVTASDREAPRRIESILVKLSRALDERVLAPDLAANLARSIVYVRGPTGSFVSPDAIEAAAATSTKDALVTCLLDPPASRSERDVAAKAHVSTAPNVHRLNDAIVGLPLLAPEVAGRAENETDLSTLLRMKRDLERAPLEGAKQAARAELLLAAMDEPGEGATELDGERKHHVRVVLVDLATERTLLDVRELADPSWISLARRPMHARAYDSCLVAFDVRAAVRP